MNATNLSVGRLGLFLGIAALLAGAGCHSPKGTPRAERNFARLRARAEKGDMGTQFELGEIYANGDGVPRNDEAAFNWYRTAADQGHALAQYRLGLFYKEGRGVRKDYVEAYMWFNLAAARGNADAGMRLDSLARLMSRDQINQAQRQAAGFVPQKPGALPRRPMDPTAEPPALDKPDPTNNGEQ